MSLLGVLAANAGSAVGRGEPRHYRQSVYDAALVQPQQTNCWCVVAAARAMLLHTDRSLAVTQAGLNPVIAQHDKNNWTDPQFKDYLRCRRGSPAPSFAHDSRGMAFALWNWLAPKHPAGYSDYSSTSQRQMNWSIVRGIRATGAPVGVVAAAGMHMILVTGYQTRFDPLNDKGLDNRIYGIRVWDPWNGAGFGNWSGWPRGGLAGDAFIAIGDWNSRFFRADRNEGPFYAGRYVAVLRSSVVEPPSDQPALSYGDWMHGDSPSPSPTPTSTSTPTAPPTATPTPTPTAPPTPSPTPNPTSTPTATATPSASASVTPPPSSSAILPAPAAQPGRTRILDAVASGLVGYGLLGDPDLANLTSAYTVGTSIHVESLVAGIPSYELVELLVGGVVRAIAVVNDVPGSYELAELWPVTGNFRLPTQTDLDAQARISGLRGSATAVWAWTRDGAPPVAPMLAARDASGAQAVLTPDGIVTQQQLVDAGPRN